jgi:hypothetical protein
MEVLHYSLKHKKKRKNRKYILLGKNIYLLVSFFYSWDDNQQIWLMLKLGLSDIILTI